MKRKECDAVPRRKTKIGIGFGLAKNGNQTSVDACDASWMLRIGRVGNIVEDQVGPDTNGN